MTMRQRHSLVLENLEMRYGSRVLYSALSARFEGGQLIAVRGPSGSGKSTLLANVAGLTRPQSGRVVIDGLDVTKLRGRALRRFRRYDMGFLFQDFGLIDDERCVNNVTLGTSGRSWTASARSNAGTQLAAVGLAGKERQRVYELSGGEQQRTALARLMMRQPKIVLADEPTAALDRDNATIVVDTLRNFADAGAVVLIATHDEWVASHCATSLTVA